MKSKKLKHCSKLISDGGVILNSDLEDENYAN